MPSDSSKAVITAKGAFYEQAYVLRHYANMVASVQLLCVEAILSGMNQLCLYVKINFCECTPNCSTLILFSSSQLLL